MYLIGAVTTGIFCLVIFAMLHTMIPAVIFLAIVLSFIPHDMMYGPQAALIAECFAPRLRYSAPRSATPVVGDRRRAGALIATALLAATAPGMRWRSTL